MTATLHAAIPAEWRPYSARDMVVVARPPVDTGWFCTTVLIGREDVPVDVPIATLFDATRDALTTLGDDVEVIGDRYAVVDDIERASRLVAFDLAGAPGRVVQLQCFVASRRAGPTTRTVVQFAGTCAFDELDRYGPAFVRVIESIRLSEHDEDGPVASPM